MMLDNTFLSRDVLCWLSVPSCLKVTFLYTDIYMCICEIYSCIFGCALFGDGFVLMYFFCEYSYCYQNEATVKPVCIINAIFK